MFTVTFSFTLWIIYLYVNVIFDCFLLGKVKTACVFNEIKRKKKKNTTFMKVLRVFPVTQDIIIP